MVYLYENCVLLISLVTICLCNPWSCTSDSDCSPFKCDTIKQLCICNDASSCSKQLNITKICVSDLDCILPQRCYIPDGICLHPNAKHVVYILSPGYASCVKNQSANQNATYKWWCWKFHYDDPLDWPSAWAECKKDGGRLATLYNQDYWFAFQNYKQSLGYEYESPWVALSSTNGADPLNWYNGPDFASDITNVTTAGQNLISTNSRLKVVFTINPSNYDYMVSIGWGGYPCCYLAFKGYSSNASGVCMDNYVLNTDLCYGYAAYRYVCEYTGLAIANYIPTTTVKSTSSMTSRSTVAATSSTSSKLTTTSTSQITSTSTTKLTSTSTRFALTPTQSSTLTLSSSSLSTSSTSMESLLSSSITSSLLTSTLNTISSIMPEATSVSTSTETPIPKITSTSIAIEPTSLLKEITSTSIETASTTTEKSSVARDTTLFTTTTSRSAPFSTLNFLTMSSKAELANFSSMISTTPNLKISSKNERFTSSFLKTSSTGNTKITTTKSNVIALSGETVAWTVGTGHVSSTANMGSALVQECTVQWQEYSKCSVTCGNGLVTNKRTVFNTSLQICTDEYETRTCSNPKCLPMTYTESIIAKILHAIGCSWILLITGTTIVLLGFLRASDLERVIHIGQEISLFGGHVLIFLMVGREYLSYTICTWISICLQHLFISHFLFIMLDTLQIYSMMTNFLVAPFIPTGINVLLAYDHYWADFSCWLNLGHDAASGTIVPIAACVCVSIVALESAGQWKTAFAISDRKQILSARINQRSLLFIIPASVAAWFMGLFAIYSQLFSMYVVVFWLNIGLGLTVLVFHMLGNHKARSVITKLFYCLKKKE